ncbi:MAG: DeoR/GlpR transcriptional regulator, partial [Lachnospiraceae bacterium]|nr:DeoR/GlpR transcriptional regulator [Lachnospiraceae bacterium]
MRRKEDRTGQILELLVGQQKIEVAELAAKLQVSQVTIRKDLDDMEERGLITREHGYAALSDRDDIQGRLAVHYEEKMKIARRAADLVEDGETIMIESGSCCALLARVLAQSKKDLTIITNSAFIAAYIRGAADFQIILLGGIYQPSAQVMVGPMVRQCAENFWVD